MFVVPVAGGIHGGPAVDEFFEQQALDAALVDDGEELVLQVRAAARDLVDEYRFGTPDGCGGLDVFEGAVFAREREADEVVVIDQAGVVVPPLKAEAGRYAVEQIRFPGPVRSDEQQGLAPDEGAEDRGLDGFHPDDAQLGEK